MPKLLPEQVYETDVTNAEWQVLEPVLIPSPGPGRPRTVDLRRIVNGLRYFSRTGCQWRLLPKEFGPWRTVRYYFDRWTQDGTFERLNLLLVKLVRQQLGRSPLPSAAILDSQSVKTTEAGGPRGYDGGKKGHGTETASAQRHPRERAGGLRQCGGRE